MMLAHARYAAPVLDPLIDWPPAPAVPLDPAIGPARERVLAAATDLLAIADEALERPWRWRPADAEDVELRYGVYRMIERLDEAAAAIVIGRAAAADEIGPATPALAAATATRWDLQGALLPLPYDLYDADPGGGEWTIRRTLAHVIGGQRSYGWYNAWYLHQPTPEGQVAVYPADGVLPPEPEWQDESAGDPATVRAAIDDIVDRNIVAFAGVGPAEMRAAARWSDLSVTIDFRLGRYGSHIREHTVQVDKTLDLLGRRPSEVERLVRLLLDGYGRLEALLVARRSEALAVRFADGSDAPGIATAASSEVAEIAGRVRAAGG
jgi:hypothetical protein